MLLRKKLWFFLKEKQPKITIKVERTQETKNSKRKIKKQSEDNIITDLRNQVLKRHRTIKDKIIRHIRTCFEEEEECYCKPVRLRNFCSNIYIEHGSNNGKVKHFKSKKTLKKLNHV